MTQKSVIPCLTGASYSQVSRLCGRVVLTQPCATKIFRQALGDILISAFADGARLVLAGAARTGAPVNDVALEHGLGNFKLFTEFPYPLNRLAAVALSGFVDLLLQGFDFCLEFPNAFHEILPWIFSCGCPHSKHTRTQAAKRVSGLAAFTLL